jgi:SGNH hydrolase-like domain, acetyltransferase AlgX
MNGTRSGNPGAASGRARALIVFGLIVVAQFGVFEAALRTWGHSEAAPAFQGLFDGDAGAGYRLKPNARVRFTTSEFDTEIHVNAAGVRDDEEVGPKAPNERRIVLLGDSLVLSVQVPFRDTFGELLEQRLNARPSPYRYRVINAGVQGYGPVEELFFFKSIAATLQPDLVIETIFVGNDAEEAVRSAPRLLGDARPASEAVTDTVATRLRRLVRRSMVLQLLRLRVVSATDRFSGTLSAPEPPLQSYAAHPAARIADGLAVSRQCVRDIAATAAATGASTAIALMPARFQVDDADYGRLREAVAAAGGELQRDAATERFDAALAELPLPRLDLLPALRHALPGPDLFFQETVHLTPRGHRVVADALDRFIDEHHLLAAEPARPAR